MIVSKLSFVNILIVFVFCWFSSENKISRAVLSFFSILNFHSCSAGSHLVEIVLLQFVFCLKIGFGDAFVGDAEFFSQVIGIRDVGPCSSASSMVVFSSFCSSVSSIDVVGLSLFSTFSV